jgi:hypothetical protein
MTLRSIISRWKGRTRIFDTVPQPYTSHTGPLAHKVVVRSALAWLRCTNEVKRGMVFGSRAPATTKRRADRKPARDERSAADGADSRGSGSSFLCSNGYAGPNRRKARNRAKTYLIKQRLEGVVVPAGRVRQDQALLIADRAAARENSERISCA